MNTTHKITLACDMEEADKFAAWLNAQGHKANVGRDTGCYIDGVYTANNPEASTVLCMLWEEYCAA